MENKFLSSLKIAHDSKITKVILEVPSCTFCQFSGPMRQWVKTSISGALLLLERSEEPYFQLLILYKANNQFLYCQPLTSTVEFERKSLDFLLVKENDRFHGLWIPEKLDSLYEKIQELRHTDNQSKFLKSLLDIGPERPVLKDSFFADGIDLPVETMQKETVRRMMLALSQSDEFLELIVQALQPSNHS